MVAGAAPVAWAVADADADTGLAFDGYVLVEDRSYVNGFAAAERVAGGPGVLSVGDRVGDRRALEDAHVLYRGPAVHPELGYPAVCAVFLLEGL